MWIIYSLVIWVASVIYLFYQLNQDNVETEKIIYAILPVLGLPAGIYYIRKGLVLFYEGKQKKEEANLTTLRKEQKSKLEELKKKTSYYSTQSLLERYDEVLAKKKEEAAKQEKMQQELRQRKPVSMPMRPLQQQQQGQPGQRSGFPPPNTMPNGPYPQQQQQQGGGPILPQPRSEPQWYDKIVDALVGDAGPETKYALICTHCFHHNGLVFKEEYDSIQYVCPNCKQFNPSRKSKRAVIHQHAEEIEKEKDDLKKVVEEEEEGEEEEDKEAIVEKLKAQLERDTEATIGARVRQRHIEEEI
ncbi:unnamed protein product [Mucor hiemalis]